MTVNKAILIGNLGQDPDLRQTLFGLYLQTGRFCPLADPLPAGCLAADGAGNRFHDSARWLVQQDPWLLELVSDPELRALLARPTSEGR